MYGDSWRPKTFYLLTSPYDGTEPVILLRPEDMRARPDHQLPMHSCVDWEIYSDSNEW